MDKATGVYILIEAIIFLIPLATLIWKCAKIASRVEQNEKDITKLEEEHKESINSLNDKIDKLIDSVNEIKISIAEIRKE